MTLPFSIAQARGIMCALSVLQGGTATGSFLVHSTGATGTVPAHSYGVPIIGGALAEDALVRVDKNPDVTDGSWPVTDAGVAVTVTAVQGGTRGNLTAGTEILWDVPIDGIETKSSTVLGLTGGTWSTAFGALKQIKEYRELDQDTAVSLFRAQVVDTPAAVLSWLGSMPVSGSVSAAYGATQDRAGRGRRLFKNEWALFLVTTRQSDLAIRLREGAALRDDVMQVLTELVAARGQVLSYPQGIEILDAKAYGSSATSFVDLIRFTTSFGLVRRDTQEFSDWLTTRLREFYAQGTHPSELDVPDITFEMTSGGFDSGFSIGFAGGGPL